MSKKKYTYDFLQAEQGKHSLLVFFAPAKEIWECVSINQKEEDADGGYQRAVSVARAKAISKFVDEGNPLPLSILISLEKSAFKIEDGKLTITAAKKSGWVIDGQHRLFGAMKAEKDILIPVIAFKGLSLGEQIHQFVTINKEAKGVPTSLYYSLLKQLPAKLSTTETAKERAADIALRLKSNELSAFSGRIVSTTSPKNGQISLVNFVRKIAPLVKEDSGLLGSYSIEEQEKIIDNLYMAIKSVFFKEFDAADSVFFLTVGFGGVMNFFPTLFSYVLKEKQSFTVSDVAESLSVLKGVVDVEKWRKMGSGSAAELQLGKDLAEEFRQLSSDDSSSATIKLS